MLPSPLTSQAQSHTDTSPDTTISVVIFTIGSQRYAVLVADVQEIIRLPALLTLVGSPPMLCGLLNLHGQQLPVLSSHAVVGESPYYDINSQIIIIGHEAPELGLLVEQVQDVDTCISSQITPLDPDAVAPFQKGVMNVQESSVILLDSAELCALNPLLGKEIDLWQFEEVEPLSER